VKTGRKTGERGFFPQFREFSKKALFRLFSSLGTRSYFTAKSDSNRTARQSLFIPPQAVSALPLVREGRFVPLGHNTSPLTPLFAAGIFYRISQFARLRIDPYSGEFLCVT
jgi:hypothetical protein